MSPRVIARRYAYALFDLAQRRGELDALAQEVEALQKLQQQTPLLRSLLTNPTYRAQQKLGWLRRALQPYLSPLLWTFIELVTRRGREALLADTWEEFGALYDSYKKRLRVVLRSAQPLDEATRLALVQKLQQAYSAEEVLLNETLEPALIGGFIVELGTKAADLSVRGRLQTIRKKLLQA
ncbi:MAG: ATP synthase F1 subunit delta [Bacteroidia bacterium]